jgi:nucleoid-associated protein YgaU
MGRDKVLGLSLAILLIGFGGAFCFRNEPFVENGLKLARAKILDEGIARRPGPKPYVAESKRDASAAPASKPTVTLGGIEALEPVDPPKVAHRLHAGRSTPKPQLDQDVPTSPRDPPAAPPRSDQFVSAQTERRKPAVVPTTVTPADPSPRPKERSADRMKDDRAKEDRAKDDGITQDRAKQNTASIDRPIELSIRPASPAFDSPDSLLEDAATWQHPPDGHDGCPAMTGADHREITSPRVPPTASLTTYTVRRGDTLSRISLQLLGDANRYREIFAANRDQLPSVNARLKIGMTLRIPDGHPHARRSSTSTASKTKTSRTTNSGNTVPKTRQVPAQPVSRVRETPRIQARETDRSTPPANDDQVQQPTGQLRFVPVQRGPFLRSRGDSSTVNGGGRDLSQRPPTTSEQSRGKRDVDSRDGSASSSSTKKRANDGDAEPMGSDGEGT